MKKLIFIMALFLVLIAMPSISAINKTFEWDANTEADLAGYRIYMSATPGGQTLGESSPDKIATLGRGPNPGGAEEVTILIPAGTWYFVATAFDTEGLESSRSNEISTTITPEEGQPPGCPISFRWIKE